MANTFISRIAQVDAGRLDYEIVDIFKRHILESTNQVYPGLFDKYEPEINLIIKILIYKYSIVSTNSSFGQQLLAIKYDNFTKPKLYAYAVLTFGLKYFKERFHLWTSWIHHRSILFNCIRNIEGTIMVASFINFLIFLRNGEKPFLVDRVLNLKQVSTVRRYINPNIYNYITREILWHSFIELLIITLPLFNYHSLIRKIRNLNPWAKSLITSGSEYRLFRHNTKCPNCKEKPVLPHHMGCAHIFCYYCLQANLDADLDYQCPECNFSGRRSYKLVM